MASTKIEFTDLWGANISDKIKGEDDVEQYLIHLQDQVYNSKEAEKQRSFEANQSAIARNWQSSMQDKQNDYNTEMWNKTNEYNSPDEQLKRANEAGINPAFAANQLSDSSASPIPSSSAPSASVPSGSTASIGSVGPMHNNTLQALQMASQITDTAIDVAKAPSEIANLSANSAQQANLADNLSSQTSLLNLTKNLKVDELVQSNRLLEYQGLKTDADRLQARAQTSAVMHKVMQDYIGPATHAILGKYNLSENAGQFRVSILERAQEANQIAQQRAAQIKQHNYDLSYAYGTKSIDSFKRGSDLTSSTTDKTNNAFGLGLNAGADTPLFKIGANGNFQRSWGLDKYQQEFNTSTNEMSDINNIINHDLFNKLDALQTLHLIIVDKEAPHIATQKAFKQFNDLLDDLDKNLTIEIQKTATDYYKNTESVNPYPFERGN